MSSPSGATAAGTESPKAPGESKVIIRWSEVPESWAAWSFAGGGAGSPRGFLSIPSLLALHEMEWLDPPEKRRDREDAQYRAWGLLNSLDYLLASACELKPRDDSISEDRRRIPLLLLDGVEIPDDPGPARDRLLALFKDGFGSLTGRLPLQHGGEGMEDAFRTRALGMLAALGSDPRAREILSSHLGHVDPRIRAAAAHGMLAQGDSSAVVAILSEGESNPALASLLGALSGFNRRRVTREDGTLEIVPDIQVDRSLDAHLLEAARRMPSRRDLISALAVRVDNPDIRMQVQAWLLNSNEPTLAAGIVRVHPDVAAIPEYPAAAARWLMSDNPDLRHWGLTALADIRDPGVPKLVSGLIASDDPTRVVHALRSQCRSAALDPRTVMDGIQLLVDRKMINAGSRIYAEQALTQIAGAEGLPSTVRDEAVSILDRMGAAHRWKKK